MSSMPRQCTRIRGPHRRLSTLRRQPVAFHSIRRGRSHTYPRFRCRRKCPKGSAESGWAARRLAEAPWLAGSEQGGFVREVMTHYVYLCRRLFGELVLAHATVRGPVAESSRAVAPAALMDRMRWHRRAVGIA